MSPRVDWPIFYLLTRIDVFRDGGGGVTVGGHNLMMFSDSYTTNQEGNASAPMTSFNANTFAYATVSNTQSSHSCHTDAFQTSSPSVLSDFGSNGLPVLEIALESNETYQGNGRYAVWPSQSMITFGSTAVGVVPVVINTNDPSAIVYQYNTLVQVTIGSSGPVATRLVPNLFSYTNEIPYGSFGILSGPDGYTYLFAADTTGLKAARVQNTLAALQNRNLYQYYNRGVWSSIMPAQNDAQSNIFNYTANYFGDIVGLYSGEMFFSPYHNTYVLVFMDGWVDGSFQVVYSTNGQLTGPWSSPSTIYCPAAASNTWNYAGHAYPAMDPTGKTLTLSYTYGNVWINVAKVTWCNGASSSCSDTSTTASKKRSVSEDLSYEQFMANNGPCRLKYPSGCNLVIDEVEWDSNTVLAAHINVPISEPLVV